jgi:hypothetical protein
MSNYVVTYNPILCELHGIFILKILRKLPNIQKVVLAMKFWVWFHYLVRNIKRFDFKFITGH